MFHTAGQIDTLMDWRNDCKWVQGARCSMDAEPADVPPVCMTLKKLFNLVLQRCISIDPKCDGELD
eukprot:7139237-Karenia_brevis.AAC.1